MEHTQSRLQLHDDGNPPSRIAVVVSSRNPVKINAARQGFTRMFPQHAQSLDFAGVTVPSGVAEQPLSDDETLRGAVNRVHAARELQPGADYWVGLEGGVDEHEGCIRSFAWIAVSGRDGRIGKARTSSFYQPEEVAVLVRRGLELGHADDIVFGSTNSKQANGSAGLLTGDVLTRASSYTDAVILALIPFKNPHLTFGKG